MDQKVELKPTIEQERIIEKVHSTKTNLVINALAGTGKTSTLEMVECASKDRPILYLAFNKKVAEEAESKFSSLTTVRTLNSLGHRIWASSQGQVTLNADKTKEHLRSIISEVPKDAQGAIWNVFWNVVEGVSMAKALGYVPDGKFPHAKRLTTREVLHASLEEKPDELTADLIDAVLTLSIQSAYKGHIDFNDQLYMPTLFGGAFPRYPLVMADEVQDFSPLNHYMLDKLGRNRLIAVGDPWQSIYAFRGAKTKGMEELTTRFKAETCPLSLCFRCPQAVVEAAHFRVPMLKWTKPGGTYERLSQLETGRIASGAAIICRNNAPIFKLAMQLLQAGRSVQVLGSEIGPKVVSIMRKFGDSNMPYQKVLSAIENWREKKLQKESRTANDLADCMKIFATHGVDLGRAIAYAEDIFKRKGNITLTTGHKAKGLEWDTVYHLDPWLCREDEQDLNLRYVITTRARQGLYEIDSARIK